jgi:hypothetical protein
MAEPMSGPDRCPWCSAVLPEAAVEKCPSCGAQLVTSTGSDPNLPGVTTIDAEAILRARSEVGRSRGGIMSFLTGVEPPPDSGGSAASLAPPPDAVRREMLRLELEAARADAVAEQVALKADVVVDRGIHLDDLAGEPGPDETALEAEPEPASQAEPASPAAPKPPAGS